MDLERFCKGKTAPPNFCGVRCYSTEGWQCLNNSVILMHVCQITSVTRFINSVIRFSNSVIRFSNSVHVIRFINSVIYFSISLRYFTMLNMLKSSHTLVMKSVVMK